MLITTALLLQPLVLPPSAPHTPSLLETTELLELSVPLESAVVLAPQSPQGPRKKGRAHSELSWNFVEVHFLNRDVDAINDTLGGVGAEGAWQFDEGIFVLGGLDFYSGDEDLDTFNIGVGQTVPVRSDASAFAAVSWVWQDLSSAGNSDFSENGWRVQAGFRAAFDEKLGGEIHLGYEDVSDNGFLYGADLRYWLFPQVALGLGYEVEVDDNIWTLGLRYSF